MLTNEQLRQISESPKAFLKAAHESARSAWVTERRIQRLRQISTATTTTIKAASAYTGPGDKVGSCAVEIAALTDELDAQVIDFVRTQRAVQEAITELVSDPTCRSILEARYLADLRWEEIAYSFHYVYRWVMRLQRRGLMDMQENAKKRLKNE
jgi:DNA-directed RNA polymerase specialized sigma24 family protein